MANNVIDITPYLNINHLTMYKLTEMVHNPTEWKEPAVKHAQRVIERRLSYGN